MSYRESYRLANLPASSENVYVIAEDPEGDEAVIVKTDGSTHKVPLSTINQGPTSDPNLVLHVGTGGTSIVGPTADYNSTESVTDGIRIVEPRRAPEWDTTRTPGCSPVVYETLNYKDSFRFDNFSFPIRRGQVTFTYTPRVRIYKDVWNTANGRAKQDAGRIASSTPNTITIAGKNWTPDFFAGGYLYVDKDLVMAKGPKFDFLKNLANETPQRIDCTTNTTLKIHADYQFTMKTDDYVGAYITVDDGGFVQTRQVHRNTGNELTITEAWDQNPSATATFTIDGPVQGWTQGTSQTPGTHLRYDVLSNTADTITTTTPISQAWRQPGVHAHVFKEFADPIIHGWLLGMDEPSGSPWIRIRTWHVRVNPLVPNQTVEGGPYVSTPGNPGKKFVQFVFQNRGQVGGYYYASTPDLGEWVQDQSYNFDVKWDQPVNPGPVRLTLKIDGQILIDESTPSFNLPDYKMTDLYFGNRADLQSAEYSFPAQNNMQGDLTNIKLFDLTNT